MSNWKRCYFPNAPAAGGTTYYVAQNHPKASDDNPGTLQHPFRTITKAASVVQMGDTVVIGEGVYREEVPIVRHGHMYVPTSLVTFKAATGKKVYLKGSDPFNPEWQDAGSGVYRAALPESLFREGAYNPYELSCAKDEPGKVRPCTGPYLPETLGQIYIDGQPLEQAISLEKVKQTPGMFVISSDGKEILVHLAGSQTPEGRNVELTVRRRCFKPAFSGPLFIQTLGMVVEHAAEPGAFCRCQPLSIRHNPGTGIVVRKTYNLPGNTDYCCNLMGNVSYLSNDRPELISSYIEDTPCPFSERKGIIATSVDGGKSWQPVPGGTIKLSEQSLPYHFLDEEHNRLIRCVRKLTHGNYLDCESSDWENFVQYSSDQGKTWSEPEKFRIGRLLLFYQIIRLQDGTLLWLYTENQSETGFHVKMCALLGRWNRDLTGVEWKQGGTLEVDPRQSSGGLDEPQACQFPDGRVFVILRQGNVLPTQEYPGVPSLKLFTISEDGGRTWSEPRPLAYEDGKYLYSSRSYADTVCSIRNKRVYVMLNICSHSTDNCDPRTELHIAEFAPEKLCVKRKSVAVIDARLDEHHWLVRFSNWSSIQDRDTGNLILFMKMHMSQYCPVRNGYDANSYRYEIILPEA